MFALRVVIYVISGLCGAFGVAYYSHMHSTRWGVKTLADGFEVRGEPVRTTVREQTSIPTTLVEESMGRQKSECGYYVLQADLVEVLIDADGDYHLVIQDSGMQMIAEIPDPDPLIRDPYRKQFIHARKVVRSIIGDPKQSATILDPPVRIELAGVGFFDEPHLMPPAGTAKNFREIHPVCHIRVVNP